MYSISLHVYRNRGSKLDDSARLTKYVLDKLYYDCHVSGMPYYEAADHVQGIIDLMYLKISKQFRYF